MNTLFSAEFWMAYMLPSAVSLTVFYLLYKVVVRNDTHLKIRRFTILGIVVFSMVLPFLNFQIIVGNVETWHAASLQNFIYQLPVFTVFAEGSAVTTIEARHATSLPIFHIIGWMYLAVVLLMIGRGLFGILRLEAFAKTGRRFLVKDTTIVLSSDIPTAFSFFSTIFMPETSYNDDEKEMMLAHECAHINQKHSWDLMLMNVVCVIQFFNPFVWLLKREMRLNHEYLADREALKNNKKPEQYFELLLREAAVKQPILVHSFHYSPLKHRIMMQLTKPAKLLNQVRYLAFLPVVLALTFLFACEKKPNILEEILSQENIELSTNPLIIVDGEVFDGTLDDIGLSSDDIQSVTVLKDSAAVAIYGPQAKHGVVLIVSKANAADVAQSILPTNATVVDIQNADPIFRVVEINPSFPGGEEARMKFLQENIKYPAEARDKRIEGTVFVSFVVEKDGSITDPKILRGIGGGCDEEVIRIVKSMPNWTPGQQRGQNVRVQFNMPIRFTLSDEASPSSTGFYYTTPNTDPIFQVVEDMPEFPGGTNARTRFLQQNLRYPAEAREKGIQGMVVVTFVVETDGSITNPKIIRGIGGGCDEEAIRIIKMMPNWTPGKQRGQVVRTEFMLVMSFRLDGEDPPPGANNEKADIVITGYSSRRI